MIFQNKDGLCFYEKKGDYCHPSLQNALLQAALISLVPAGQHEEIELEILETLHYFIFWHLYFPYLLCIYLFFLGFTTETNGRSSYCEDS